MHPHVRVVPDVQMQNDDADTRAELPVDVLSEDDGQSSPWPKDAPSLSGEVRDVPREEPRGMQNYDADTRAELAVDVLSHAA